jgi:hypothetical protein
MSPVRAALVALALVVAPDDGQAQRRTIECETGEIASCTYEVGGGLCHEGHPQYGNCICRCVRTHQPDIGPRTVQPTPATPALGAPQDPGSRQAYPPREPRYLHSDERDEPRRPRGNPTFVDPKWSSK